MGSLVHDQEWRKHTLDPKGDHILKEYTGEAEATPPFRANGWSPHTLWAPKSGTQREGAGPILLEGGIATGTIAGRRTQLQPEEGDPNTKARNQTHQKEGKSSLRSRTEEEHSPDLRQVTPSRRPRAPQDRGTQRHRGPTRAGRQASDRKTG